MARSQVYRTASIEYTVLVGVVAQAGCWLGGRSVQCVRLEKTRGPLYRNPRCTMIIKESHKAATHNR